MSETPSVESVSGDVRSGTEFNPDAVQAEPTRELYRSDEPAGVSGTPTDPRIAMLVSALERVRLDFVSAVNGLPVRDMTETLAECDAALAAVDVGDTLEQVGVEYRYVRTIGDEPASPWQFAREGPRNVNPVLWRVESRPVFVRVGSSTPNKETRP